jgi:hypothetical protein
MLDNNHSEFRDPNYVLYIIGNYTAAIDTAALNNSQFISIKPLSTDAVLVNSLLLETLLLTVDKHKLYADKSTAY